MNRLQSVYLRRAILIVDPLQLSDVKVPHPLQPLQLCLDLSFLLDTRDETTTLFLVQDFLCEPKKTDAFIRF